MNNNGAAQDELQQAINNITNASKATEADSTEAVAQIEDRIKKGSNGNGGNNGGKGGKPVLATPVIPAPAAPAAPAMPAFMNNATAPLGEPETKAFYGDPDLDRVKASALSDLRPIIEKVDLPVEKKFLIYKEIIETTNDKSCIEGAYNAAKGIQDEKARAEALLFVVESIDRLGVQMPKK